jgi:hypothetical protein
MENSSKIYTLNTRPNHNTFPPQTVLKAKLDGHNLADSDEDPHVYKSRPQLPQPNVHMRNIASLIGKREH